MADILRNTIDQMLVLASFCKLAKVPFDVYGFTDDNYSNHRLQAMYQSKNRFLSDPTTEMYVGRTSFHLKHLIGSSLSPIQYRRAFNLLCVVANEYYRFYDYHLPNQDKDHGCFDSDWTDAGFGLNGTPFAPTLLASREIITQFQNKNQLDVCNVVYLTDGDGGNDLCYPPCATYDDEMKRHKSVIYLVDKKTKKKVKLQNQYNIQSALTRLVADVTGCKHIGFYVGGRRAIQRDMKYLVSSKSHEDQAAAKKSWREGNYFITDRIGYDKYFYVAIPNSNIEDDELVITKDMTKNKMAREFSKNLGSKRTNRLLLTKLAEELAVA